MRKTGKKYAAARAQVPERPVTLGEAKGLVDCLGRLRYTGSLTLHVTLSGRKGLLTSGNGGEDFGRKDLQTLSRKSRQPVAHPRGR